MAAGPGLPVPLQKLVFHSKPPIPDHTEGDPLFTPSQLRLRAALCLPVRKIQQDHPCAALPEHLGWQEFMELVNSQVGPLGVCESSFWARCLVSGLV